MQFGFFEIFSGALAGFFALVPSYGLAIILLTVAVRVVLLPLSIKQTRSMREMQRIQPEIKRLQAKYKGNRQKMNEELMALYKEHSVNPFGGCLPLLMQFPVLIALFWVVRAPLKYMGYGIEGGRTALVDFMPRADASGVMERLQNSALADNLHSAETGLATNRFLSLRLDCSPAEVLSGNESHLIEGISCGGGPQIFGVDLVAALPYLVLVLLMGFTTYYQQKQMTASRGSAPQDATAQQMQMVGRIMPIMLMFFAYTFPMGVVLYWLTTNVWTIGQQRLVLAAVPPAPTGTPAGKKGAAPADGKGETKAKPGGAAAKKKQAGGAKSKGAAGGGDGRARSGGGSRSPNKKKRRR